VQAEQVISVEYGFTASPPVEMTSASGTHDRGKVICYQGWDEPNAMIYMITVNQDREVAKAIKTGPATLREMLGATFLGYSKSLKVADENQTQQWKTSLAKDALHFTFNTTGFAPNGELTFHRGMSVFHRDAIYTLQVISVGKRNGKSEAAFDSLLKAFVLIDTENEPATPPK
jgi:hypothetical protein